MLEAAGRGRLLLARHGRTAWNAEHRRLGRTDVPLDDVGRAQATALCHALREGRLDAIYASPLSRALETATPVAQALGLRVRIEPDLMEFDYGTYAGSVREQVKLTLRRDHLYRPVPDGESLADAWERARRVVSRLAPVLASEAHVLVVGHQRLNRLIVGVMEGRTLEDTVTATHYRPHNGSVLEMWIGAGRRVLESSVLELNRT